MTKLYKYLDKIGVNYSRETFGTNYFYNAPALKFGGAVVWFEYDNGDARAEVKRAAMVEKYCARYGYKITSRGGFPGCSYIHVAKTSDALDLELYNAFKADSEAACEKWIHTWFITGTPMTDAEKNDVLRGVMDFYGEEYCNALKETGKATA